MDTAFWIAVLSPRDELHHTAEAWARRCDKCPLVTTDSVLNETQTFFAGQGPDLRRAAAKLVADIENNPRITVVHDHEYVKAARRLYGERLDKGYSSVDCISMVVMEARGISLALTSDKHFVQEGRIALLRLDPKAKGEHLP